MTLYVVYESTGTELVNCRQATPTHWNDRRSQFGNPFKLVEDGSEIESRERSVALYEGWFRGNLRKNETFAMTVHELYGERLGCHCLPEKCHGEVILTYLAPHTIHSIRSRTSDYRSIRAVPYFEWEQEILLGGIPAVPPGESRERDGHEDERSENLGSRLGAGSLGRHMARHASMACLVSPAVRSNGLRVQGASPGLPEESR